MSDHPLRGLLCKALWLAFAACLACSESRPMAGDSESHFLARCDEACPGGLVCLCGVCTRACDADDACSDLAANASCQPTLDGAACGDEPRACAIECDGDARCEALGEDFTCRQRRCEPAQEADAGSASVDSGTPGELACLRPVDAFPTFGGGGFEVAGEYLLSSDRGALLRFDGSEWHVRELAEPVDAQGFGSIWAAAPDDVYYVTEPAIMHLDGVSAEPTLEPGEAAPTFFTGVYGFASDDVWAVGYGAPTCDDCSEPVFAEIYHYDGARWTREPQRFETTLWAIWGAAPDDIWAAGSLLLHYDGESWSERGTSVNGPMRLWGRSANEVYRVEPPQVFRYDGATFQALETDSHTVTDVRGLDDGELYALSDVATLLRYDGTRFLETPVAIPEPGNGRLDVFDGELLLLQHEAVYRLRGERFETLIESFDSGRLDGIWSAGDGEVLALRDDALLRYDGRWEVAARVPEGLGDLSLYALDGLASDDLWIAAFANEAGAPRAFHWDGDSLAPRELAPAPSFGVYDIYVDDDGEVWAVGEDSGEPIGGDEPVVSGPLALRFDAEIEAEPAALPQAARLIDGAGAEVYAAGDGLMRWDGSGFALVQDAPFDTIIDLYAATEDVLYLLGRRGDDPVAARFDGARFEELALPTGVSWQALAGIASDAVWLSGESADSRVALAHLEGDAFVLSDEFALPASGAARPIPLDAERLMISTYESTWLYECAGGER